jgi:cytochrome c2
MHRLWTDGSTNTDIVTPGNDISFRLNNADERENIIIYLKAVVGK